MKKLILLFAAILIIFNCSNEGTGTLKVKLTDAPTDEFEDVTINIKEVNMIGQKQTTGKAILSFADGEKKMNLLDLQNTSTLLGEAEVTEGKYTQIRLVVYETGNTARPVDGEDKPLTIASGDVTGAKLVISGGLEITADEEKEITLDWDLNTENSTQIKLNSDGSYHMTPVLKLQSVK
ncbi:MAG: DUF4382 domain-containing protein [Spirochaetia bacterium]|nr:DUF4382 domain-containing protein [Spirochaetia bacterium]